MESYYAAVYWGCRVESAEECARRAETFFRLLSQCDPGYTRWLEKADSRKKALQLQFEPTAETFVRFFKRRGYKLGNVGFIFGAWTGHEGRERGGMANFICGSDARGAPNSCFLYLPREEPGAERVLTAPVLTEVLRSMVLAWEPEGAAGTFVGWMTYFSRHRGEVPSLPEPVRVETVNEKGTLVQLSSERISAANSEHVSLARRVQDVLLSAGLLEPISRAPTS
jgi:hypothetical protein